MEKSESVGANMEENGTNTMCAPQANSNGKLMFNLFFIRKILM